MPDSDSGNSSFVVELEGVTVRYGRSIALEDVNLHVNAGDLLGVIGPNGGGKTTLLKVILGLTKPTVGRVRVLGREPGKRANGVGYVPQHQQFDPRFPAVVRDIVLMGRLGHTGLLRGFSREDREGAARALARVGLQGFENKPIGSLSGGQRQRVYIARALAAEPKLLLLDEPMNHVDSIIEAELYALIEKLRGDTTIVFVSHDVGVISAYANKIACLNRRLFSHDSRELTQEMVEQAYCCPVDMIAHGVPHRVLKSHSHD